MRSVYVFVSAAAMAAISGCSNGEYATAPVRGRVTVGGQPVKAGQVMFSPVMDEQNGRGANPGKAAFGNLDPEGNFVLSTYGDQDGAVIGKHRISFLDAASDSEDAEDKPPTYLVPENKAEVEVTSGKNEIQLELVANPEARRWRPTKQQDD